MREIFPENAELIAFFGAEPELFAPEVPWEYNTLTFAATRDHDKISCVIVPELIVVELTWRHRGEEVVRLAAAEIERVEILVDNGVPSLTASAPGGALRLRLWLDPRVRLFVGNGFRD